MIALNKVFLAASGMRIVNVVQVIILMGRYMIPQEVESYFLKKQLNGLIPMAGVFIRNEDDRCLQEDNPF